MCARLSGPVVQGLGLTARSARRFARISDIDPLERLQDVNGIARAAGLSGEGATTLGLSPQQLTEVHWPLGPLLLRMCRNET